MCIDDIILLPGAGGGHLRRLGGAAHAAAPPQVPGGQSADGEFPSVYLDIY